MDKDPFPAVQPLRCVKLESHMSPREDPERKNLVSVLQYLIGIAGNLVLKRRFPARMLLKAFARLRLLRVHTYVDKNC